ncbi:MAG: ankyrin repeat domain-containing protein, partial [Desulforhabdus sp.]|nr:ankyrin repeat domain-containing protein [Desulforhabdus sp.]
QVVPSVWKFMLDHGSSPDAAFKAMFLYRTGNFTDEQEATLAEMLQTARGRKGPPAQLSRMLERAIELRHFRTIVAFARHGGCSSLKFQPGEKSLLHLAAEAGADSDSLRNLANCMGFYSWRLFDASGYTPVHYLRYPKQLEALPSASEAVLLFTRDGATLLHLAVQKGSHELFNQIVQFGIATDTPDLEGCPPAFYATDFATFQRLRPRGLHPALANSEGFKRLWGNALKSCSEEFIATMLQEGADPDAILFNGNRPLHQILLSYGENLQYVPHMINRLASAGADINQPNWNGDTPLHYAIMQNNLPAAHLLIALGANTRLRNMQGKTVLSTMWETRNRGLWSDLYHKLMMDGLLAEVEHPVDKDLPDWK